MRLPLQTEARNQKAPEDVDKTRKRKTGGKGWNAQQGPPKSSAKPSAKLFGQRRERGHVDHLRPRATARIKQTLQRRLTCWRSWRSSPRRSWGAWSMSGRAVALS